MMLPWLGRDLQFPDPESALAEPDGLLAAGGDLSSARLLAGYAQGIFPWYNPGEPILWWSPSQRMVFFPEALKVSRSLDKSLRNRRYQIRVDSAFEAVMAGCAATRAPGVGTWIGPEMMAAYCALHRSAYAHSCETWVDGELLGGLYGVAIGSMFFGESMFSRCNDASKLALVHLIRHLHQHGFGMIDCQMYTPHLASLGAQLMTRTAFLARLKTLIARPQPINLWDYHYNNESS